MTHRRFIPAGAGNTAPSPVAAPHAAVHPRWRGEHGDAARVAMKKDGSSPLARGTLFVTFDPHDAIRFIPAGAGNTVAPHG